METTCPAANWFRVIRRRPVLRIYMAAVAASVFVRPSSALPAWDSVARETHDLPRATTAGAPLQLAASSSTSRDAQTERTKKRPSAEPSHRKPDRPSKTAPGQQPAKKQTASDNRRAEQPKQPRKAVSAPATKAGAAAPTGKANPENQGNASVAAEKNVDSFDEEACRARLTAAGVRFEPLPQIADAGGCGAAVPLLVSALRADVTVSTPATLTCRMAEALANWTAQAIAPDAERLLGARPTEVVIGTTYMCRPRNHQAGAKLSEHGIANAADLVGFKLDGRPAVTFAERYEDDSAQARFLAEVRKTACTYFTTVLGPGSDESHKIHMHIDMRQRKNDFRICQ